MRDGLTGAQRWHVFLGCLYHHQRVFACQRANAQLDSGSGFAAKSALGNDFMRALHGQRMS